MVKQDKLATFWDKDVPKAWKHFPENMSSEKARKLIGAFDLHANTKVTGPIQTVMDWGCGGGLLSGFMAAEGAEKVYLFDISKESRQRAHKYISKNYPECQINSLQVNNVEMLPYVLPKIDLLICYSVIQHFPSIDYCKSILKVWEQIKPKYIAIRTKTESKLKENAKYFENQNYLRGLIVTRKFMKANLPSYLEAYFCHGMTGSGQQDGYYVFELKK